MAVEIKCHPPKSASSTTPVLYEFPWYYACQVLAEMAALQVDETLFVSYSGESMAVHRIQNDPSMWNLVLSEATRIYDRPDICAPTKKTEFVKYAEGKLRHFAFSNGTFLGEFPTCDITLGLEGDSSEPSCPYMSGQSQAVSPCTAGFLLNKMSEYSKAITESFEATRQEATEIMVWLLQDTDTFRISNGIFCDSDWCKYLININITLTNLQIETIYKYDL